MGDFSKTNNQQKKLKGQSRYIKNVPDTKPIIKLWQSPKNLTGPAHKFYRETGELLVNARVLTQLDKDSFIRLAHIHGRLCALEDDLSVKGEVIDQNGKTARNPASISYKELLPQFLRLAEKFGLTPYDRKRIDLPTDDNPQDSTREFLGL